MSDLAQRLRESIKACRALDRSELLAEAADTIDRQNREVSVLVAECQSMKDLLVNGAALTDAEREAVEWCIFQQATPQGKAVALRRLLNRLW